MVGQNALKFSVVKILAIILLIAVVSALPTIPAHNVLASCSTSNGITTCTESTTLNVNINEILTVAITRPKTWASGPIDQLLTNKVSVSITSNNPAGFTATMKSATTNANLVNQSNSSSVITPLSSETATSNFTTNKWGYNVVSSDAAAPTSYFGMVGSNGTPIQIASAQTASESVTKDIYFAAKASGSVASGTYANNVIISVVSGVIDPSNNPTTPTNPITPSDDPQPDNSNTNGETNHGNTANGAVVATTTTSDSTTTTTTTESYAKPAGVTESTIANVDNGNSLTTGLAMTAGASAAAGTIFFILAKRRRNDEEDDGSEEY